MDSERLRIIQALNELDTPTSIDKIAAKSELTRGKVLGNLPRLCLDGLVDKRGRLYAITDRGRAIIREFEPVPENKAFYFYLGEYRPAGPVARSLREFYDSVKTIDSASLEFHVQRGDFEKWIREVLGDEELASEITELRSAGLSGDSLRDKLCKSVGRNYKILSAFTV